MSVLRRFARVRREEDGAVLVLVAVVMVLLLGFAALTIDFGNAMLHKHRLQAAVDLAALSASQKLPDAAIATADARKYAGDNWSTRDDPASLTSTTVTTGCYAKGCTAPDKVTVSATAKVETSFAKVLGIGSIDVHARAAACGPCDTSVRKFDVMIVLDRSYSMCLNSGGGYNGCVDLDSAKAGIRSLLSFFNSDTDRVGLAVLSSGDDRAPFDSKGYGTYPCDYAQWDGSVTGGTFGESRGDFMSGTAGNHDSWVIAPLSSAFKDTRGQLMSALDCLRAKYWTPIAPAIKEATTELVDHGRSTSDVTRAIVFFGDGGANAQPTWYTATPGNDLRPCHDAVGRAASAKAQNIELYAIGYDLNTSSAQRCYKDNKPNSSGSDEGISATQTLQAMASDSDHFLAAASPDQIVGIFNKIGHQITSGGHRLVE